MKILLDTCVWGGVKPILEAAGHDVIWSADWLDDPGDEAILATAYRERRICATLDKDFGELAVLHGCPHRGIIRLVGFASWEQSSICLQVLEKYADDLMDGAIVTATRTRFRIRRSELH
jgi:predicted nuclease of predicted toxin-antitoxin system